MDPWEDNLDGRIHRIVYETILGLNVENLIGIIGDLRDLDISMDGKRVRIPKWIKQAFAADVGRKTYSTKPHLDALIESKRKKWYFLLFKALFHGFYVSLKENYGTLQHNGKIVGILNRKFVHNPCPELVSDADIIEDPNRACFNLTERVSSPHQIMSYRDTSYSYLYLDKDFLAAHPVSKKPKLF